MPKKNRITVATTRATKPIIVRMFGLSSFTVSQCGGSRVWPLCHEVGDQVDRSSGEHCAPELLRSIERLFRIRDDLAVRAAELLGK